MTKTTEAKNAVTKTTDGENTVFRSYSRRNSASGIADWKMLYWRITAGENSASGVTEGKNTVFGEYGLRDFDTETTEGKTSDSGGKLLKNHGEISLHTVGEEINDSRENSVIGI